MSFMLTHIFTSLLVSNIFFIRFVKLQKQFISLALSEMSLKCFKTRQLLTKAKMTLSALLPQKPIFINYSDAELMPQLLYCQSVRVPESELTRFSDCAISHIMQKVTDYSKKQ